MKVYSVMNIDIIDSRKIINREAFQKTLKVYLKRLSDEYTSILVAPITITLGDEWQVVLREVGESYNIYMDIKEYLSAQGVGCYCGIGVGTISTDEAMDTREMDGQAFILAREGINIAKRNKKAYSKVIPTKDCKVYLRGPHTAKRKTLESETEAVGDYIDFEAMINNVIQNNELHLKKLTKVQRQVIEAYKKLGSYSAVENEEKISKSNVSNRLRASNYWLMKANKEMIYKLLKGYELHLKRGI
ncbi:SatD family protein [Cellulosilyticum ruminicola]|uniref:SatD family protein n=1 Tax=Cellulosilyticum ruminicola TaxID=425254 RepID=UPI0006D0CA52|nr:SatD family protein [Cellulosilyticum ruminicola]